MISICHIIQRFGLGGAAQSVLATAKYSMRLGGYNHYIISLLPVDPELVEMACRYGIKVYDAPARNEIVRLMTLSDIVQINWWNSPEMYDFLRAGLPETRLILWFHIAGDSTPQIITPNLVQLTDIALACSPYTLQCITSQNESDQDASGKKTHDKTEMVLAGADFERLQGIAPKPHQGFNVGYIGNLNFVKLHSNYISMSARIRIPDIRFIVCGSGNVSLLQQQAKELGVGSLFEFRGYVEDIKSALEIFDVYGYPLCESTYAAAELNLQEVMYAGIVPVVFPYGGVKNLVEDNVTGMLIHSEKEYAEAIEYLYQHPEERRRIGQNAKSYAKREFGVENAAIKMNKVYDRIMLVTKRCRNFVGNCSEEMVQRIGQFQKNGDRTGALCFIDSLGHTAKHFIRSMTSEDPDVIFKSEKRIANSTPLLSSVGSGGIRHYRNYYPDDPYLLLWSGLILQKQKLHVKAISEFNKAIECGLHHWRVSWYLSLSAYEIKEMTLAEKHLQIVTNNYCEEAYE